MKRILVTYATFAGSTVEVARAVADEIATRDVQVELVPIETVNTLEGYDGVVIGGPMIMGWHRAASEFLKKQRAAWQHIPFAVFVTAMSLTQTDETKVDGVQVTVDTKLMKPPHVKGRLSFQERYAQVSNYVRPILNATRPFKPVSVGLFGGRLEYGRLKWWAVLFVTLIIQAPPADRRNWTAIRAWANDVAAQFHLEPKTTYAPTLQPHAV